MRDYLRNRMAGIFREDKLHAFERIAFRDERLLPSGEREIRTDFLKARGQKLFSKRSSCHNRTAI
jgi:hypothetical protein